MLARKGESMRVDTRLSEDFVMSVKLVQGHFKSFQGGFGNVCTTSKVACIKEGTESFDNFIVNMPANSSNIDLQNFPIQ